VFGIFYVTMTVAVSHVDTQRCNHDVYLRLQVTNCTTRFRECKLFSAFHLQDINAVVQLLNHNGEPVWAYINKIRDIDRSDVSIKLKSIIGQFPAEWFPTKASGRGRPSRCLVVRLISRLKSLSGSVSYPDFTMMHNDIVYPINISQLPILFTIPNVSFFIDGEPITFAELLDEVQDCVDIWIKIRKDMIKLD
jgi:hypothetical protein